MIPLISIASIYCLALCQSAAQFGPPQLGLHTTPRFTMISSKILQGVDCPSFSDVGTKHMSKLCCCASEHTRGSFVPGRHQNPALEVSCDLHSSIADSADVFDVTGVCRPIITAIKDIAANATSFLMVLSLPLSYALMSCKPLTRLVF